MSTFDPAATDLADNHRTISGGVALSAFLGGKGTQRAWTLLILCLALFWYLSTDAGFSPLNGFWRLGSTVEVQGVVQSLIEGDHEKMGTMPGVGHVERVTIEGIHYGYMGPDGTPYTGVATGLKQNYDNGIANVGAPVTVIHSASDPERSYVKGLSVPDEAEYQIKGAAFWTAVLVALLSTFGVLHGIRRGFGLMRLFARGTVRQGRIVGIRSAPLLGGLGVRKIEFALSGGNNETYSILSSAPDEQLNGADEPILVLPDAANRAVPISLLPGHVEIDENHHVSEGDSNPYNCLWLPALCLIGYVWFAMCLAGLMSPPWVF